VDWIFNAPPHNCGGAVDFVSPTPALFELGAPLGHDSARTHR